ncbi:conserved hypothetical protein [Verrucomicrobia bacterium]|nr:conserved hypothetical protein [Verrucomicrobiota bacterium]
MGAQAAAGAGKPLLESGDQLSRDEFERRYQLMPELKKAELIEGTVFIPSPIRANRHAGPHALLAAWLATYASETPEVKCFDNPTVRLDLDNEPQPDLVLMKLPSKGGQARISADDCIEGAPEFVVEIVGSSRAYDLHQKKDAYRRNGVTEYLAWITDEDRLVWWEIQAGDYRELTTDSDGLLKSRVFPGLWLASPALLKGDLKSVLAALRHGLKSSSHQTFVSKL